MTAGPQTDWNPLARALEGELLRPGEAGYELARAPAMPRFADARPAAVARCTNAEDVATALAFAAREGVPAVARSGGHCFEGTSSTTGLVVDVSPIDAASLDGDVATIGAGARLGAVYDALAAHGRTIAAGCGPTVGISGLALGGGIGVLGRVHGLTCDSVLGADVVLRDGTTVTCDEGRDAELLWAVRGGLAARAGVVTALRMRTLPAPQLTPFHAIFDAVDAAAVAVAWQAWAPDAPGELAASLVLTVPADSERVPVVSVFGALAGGEADVDELLERLVASAGAGPKRVERAASTHRAAKQRLAVAGSTLDLVAHIDDGHAMSRSEFFARDVPAGGVAELLAHLVQQRVEGQERELDLSPLAGAYARVAPDATAFAHRDGRFLLKHTVTVASKAGEAQRREAGAWLDRSHAIAHPWGTGGVYPNFPEAGLPDLGEAYYAHNAERLRRVAATYARG